MKARIIDSVVIDIARGPDGSAVDPASLFGEGLAAEFTDLPADAPADIGPQWRRGPDGTWSAPPVVVPVKVPAALSRLDFVRFVRTTAGIDDAAFSGIVVDQNLAGFWKLLDLAGDRILPSDPFTASGLDALVATGHLTAPQKAAVLADWPTG